MEEKQKTERNGSASHHQGDVTTNAMQGSPPDDSTQCTSGPIDGGYAWIIMMAAFFISVIIDGICFSFGIFYVEFLDYFGGSASKTSMAGSLISGVYGFVGPIVSFLVNNFGFRAVTITGGLIACIAYFASSFSPNLDVLIVTYGALGGFGFGLMYLPAMIICGFYFEKRRAFATGVAVCGSGIGMFIFAPLCELLLSTYGWKGATWVIAGIALNGIVAGALFRPLEQPNNSNETENKNHHDNKHNKENVKKHTGQKHHSNDSDHKKKKVGQIAEISGMENGVSLVSFHSLSQTEAPSFGVNGSTSGFVNQAFTSGVQHLDESCNDKDTSELKHLELESRDLPAHHSNVTPDAHDNIITDWNFVHKDKNSSKKPKHQNEEDAMSEVGSVTSHVGSVTSVKDNILMDLAILLNPVFTIYGMSCFICTAAFLIPFTYLPKMAIDRDISRTNAAFLLSIIGIANTVGRVACGWISDRKWANHLQINNAALMIAGVGTGLAPFCTNYALFATYSAVFGCGMAVFVSLRSILMVDLLGVTDLSNEFGLVIMFQGLSAFAGPPLAGKIYEVTGSFHWSFYLAGGMLFLAGFICLPLKKIADWKERRDQRKQEEIMQQEMNESHSSPVAGVIA